MSEYYNAKRQRNLYDPEEKRPFRISRSKIDLFLACPRCFYLDRRLGTDRPPGYPFALNSAIDFLLKKEFDVHRAKKETHPLMKEYGIDAIPYDHEKMNEWRENFKGVQYFDEQNNFYITGAIDDLWINPKGETHVVDYKSTAKEAEVNIDASWQISYKRQMEVYQWLLRKNGLKVSNTGYFVYANGITDKKAFDAKLEFDIKIIPYDGDDKWIEPTLKDMKKYLDAKKIPAASRDCDFCNYRSAAYDLEHKKGEQSSLF
ncbi:MAG: PD-(D/E)XK nuclease family protein [bacterium]